MYKRVRKEVARNIFNRGCEVKIMPCKCNDSYVDVSRTVIIVPCVAIKKDFESGELNQFDRLINSFIYYNCNAELGYYPHYFVLESDYMDYKVNKAMEVLSR